MHIIYRIIQAYRARRRFAGQALIRRARVVMCELAWGPDADRHGAEGSMSKPVSFYSEGVKLAGDLFLPAALTCEKPSSFKAR